MVSTTAGSRFKEEKDDVDNKELTNTEKLEVADSDNLDVENTHDD
jgi:hypothetical protein